MYQPVCVEPSGRIDVIRHPTKPLRIELFQRPSLASFVLKTNDRYWQRKLGTPRRSVLATVVAPYSRFKLLQHAQTLLEELVDSVRKQQPKRVRDQLQKVPVLQAPMAVGLKTVIDEPQGTLVESVKCSMPNMGMAHNKDKDVREFFVDLEFNGNTKRYWGNEFTAYLSEYGLKAGDSVVLERFSNTDGTVCSYRIKPAE